MKAAKIVQTCGGCPSQWDMWLDDGQYIYIRYRWGHLSLNKDEPFGELVFSEQLGDEYHGFLNQDDMMQTTKTIIDWSECETLDYEHRKDYGY